MILKKFHLIEEKQKERQQEQGLKRSLKTYLRGRVHSYI